MKNIIKNFFYLEDEEVEVEETNQKEDRQKEAPKKQQHVQQVAPTQKVRAKNERKQRNEVAVNNTSNLVSIHSAAASKSAKVVLSEPRVYAEAQDIAENLKNKRATIVNLQRIDREQGKRIIDFLSGTVYALGGDIQKIGVDIFLCTPDNVEVSGEITDYFIEEL